jgi:hypothetical protein
MVGVWWIGVVPVAACGRLLPDPAPLQSRLCLVPGTWPSECSRQWLRGLVLGVLHPPVHQPQLALDHGLLAVGLRARAVGVGTAGRGLRRQRFLQLPRQLRLVVGRPPSAAACPPLSPLSTTNH